MKRIKSILFGLAFIVSIGLTQQIISKSIENQSRKQDYAEINHIKYGLFSINQWKEQLSDIINSEIADFDVKDSEKKLKPLLEAQLNSLIDGVDKKMRDKNAKTFKGRFKQAFINTFVDMKDIKEGIPKYADEIIKLMEKPKNKRNLKGMLLDKVGDYFDKTFQQQDMTQVNIIMTKMGMNDIESTKIKLNQQISDAQLELSLLAWCLIALSGIMFAIVGFSQDSLPSTQYVALVGALFLLLVSGVTTPMIDLEAKISEMSFVLFDHPVKFLNQVLYFQTKSVIDVFWIMITDEHLQMKIVGLLMVAFSIIFPVLKLLSSIGYYYNLRHARENKIVQFFVLKSGKWSMTDVMIIAIFMAYIGFNGIISSQFGKLHSADQEIVLLTTNGTSLQPGFYLFLTYSILALFLSEFLTRKIIPAEKTEPYPRND
jgi:hypothetical protein